MPALTNADLNCWFVCVSLKTTTRGHYNPFVLEVGSCLIENRPLYRAMTQNLLQSKNIYLLFQHFKNKQVLLLLRCSVDLRVSHGLTSSVTVISFHGDKSCRSVAIVKYELSMNSPIFSLLMSSPATLFRKHHVCHVPACEDMRSGR